MCALHTDYSQVWGPEGNRNILQGWYSFFLSSCYEFLSAPWLLQTFLWKVLSWTSIPMASWEYIPIAVCLGGRSRTVISKQDCFWYERQQKLSSHVFTRSYFKLNLFSLWLPAALLPAASNFWNTPAECELLYSAGGARSLLLQVSGAWASPETKVGCWKEQDWLTLIELLKSVLRVTRSEQIKLQGFYEPKFSLAHLNVRKFMPNTTEHSMNSQYNSRPIGCSFYCQCGHPFYVYLSKPQV